MKRRLVLPGLAAGALLALGGCDWGTHQDSGNEKVDHAPAKVTMNYPDGFRNVAFKCNGTVGVYVTSAGADDTLPSGIAVLPNDPNCTR